MQKIIFILTMAWSFSALASDLTAKANCHLTFEETRYVDNRPLVRTQKIPLLKGQYTSLPPSTYLIGRYVGSPAAGTEPAAFELYITGNRNAIAISLSKTVGAESNDLFYLRLDPKDSLDIRVPVAPNEGPVWNPIIKELHLICKSRS